MLKKILLAAAGIIVLICAGGALFLYTAVNREVDEKFAGTCSEVSLRGSAEDIQIDRQRKFAYLSVFDRLGAQQGAVDPGTVMRLDLNRANPSAENALLDGPELHPHGLSLHITPAGERHLYIINHPEDRSTGREVIEYYVEATPGNFTHKQSYSSPLITRANDLVAVGPNSFYVAQDVDRTSGETLTSLIYFDGTNFRSVADDIQSGGGINVSADGNTLYISETGGEVIRVVSRSPDGSVETIDNIELGTAPDNIDIAEDGSLWIGGHSNVIALAMHFIAGSLSPTQILRVDPTSNPFEIEEIYLNGGEQISSGSGGATLEKQLLIGSITAKKVLTCEMD